MRGIFRSRYWSMLFIEKRMMDNIDLCYGNGGGIYLNFVEWFEYENRIVEWDMNGIKKLLWWYVLIK